MNHIYVIVEGPTEESFVNEVLGPIFYPRQLYLVPIILGVPGHKGGRPNYARVKKDILLQLKQKPDAYCSMMIDFYGIGKGFPGTPVPPNLTNVQKVEHIERAVKEDILETIPDLGAHVRFIPYLQLHEFEALLFSDPAALARGIYAPQLANAFENIRAGFPTPEDINDNVETAPSKRLVKLCRGYQKPLYGSLAALEVGITKMRTECRHFAEWISALESLAV